MTEDLRLPRFRLPFRRSSGRQPGAPGRGPQVLTDFEGGGVGAVSLLAPDHLRFDAAAEESPRPLWFYFCIAGAQAPAVRCDLRNADQCLGPRRGWRTARPVFSPDGKTWERVLQTEYVEHTQDAGYFSFVVPVVGPRTYVAYCYPYGGAELEQLLLRIPQAGEVSGVLCQSPEGRPVPYLRLGEPQAYRSVWIIARQHAGETPASYTAEGVLELLAGLEPASLPSLHDTAYYVVPMVDVDGVRHGRYGKDRPPVDYNRDWRPHPSRPEVAALIGAMRQAHVRQPIRLVLDLHAPHHGDASCYLFGAGTEIDATRARRQARFLTYLAAAGPETIGFRPTDLRSDAPPPASARSYLQQAFQTLVLTVEMSYHLAQSGRYLTSADYVCFGRALARAADRCLLDEPEPR